MLFSSALIGLREGLEAALVVSILIAFLVKADQRASLKWVWGGVAAALVICVAHRHGHRLHDRRDCGSSSRRSSAASLSIVAVGFVTWMIFWMRATARTIAAELRGKLSDALAIGPVAVAVMALLAVGREGLETMAFFYANVRTAEARHPPAADRLHRRHRGRDRARLADLPRRDQVRPGQVLHLHRRAAGVRGRRHPRLRPARPAGGPGAARPEHARVRPVRARCRRTPGTARCSRACSTTRPRPRSCRPLCGSRYVADRADAVPRGPARHPRPPPTDRPVPAKEHS